MNNRAISVWIRQARLRARKYKVLVEVSTEDIKAILQIHNNSCAYCGHEADKLDTPFPVRSDAPLVPANILPICDGCKAKKKADDLVSMYHDRRITEETYVRIVQAMLTQPGGDLMRAQIYRATGVGP